MAKLDLYRRTNNNNTLSSQREDLLENGECAAASNLPPEQDYGVWRLSISQHCRLMEVRCSALWIADEALNGDNRAKIRENADSICF